MSEVSYEAAFRHAKYLPVVGRYGGRLTRSTQSLRREAADRILLAFVHFLGVLSTDRRHVQVNIYALI